MKRFLSIFVIGAMLLTMAVAFPLTAEETVIEIDSAEDFAAIKDNLGGSFILMADIEVSDGIGGTFTGVFNGNHHTITTNVTLFEQFNGTCTDLSIAGEIASAFEARKMASLACNARDAVITNVVSSANITMQAADLNAGGIVGYAVGTTTFTNCTYSGTYTMIYEGSNGGVGGIAGWVNTVGGRISFINCTNSGTFVINASESNPGGDVRVGGICGNASCDNVFFECCLNVADIIQPDDTSFDGKIGGICGQATNSTFNDCYNYGDITATKAAGGILGYFDGTNTVSINDGATYGTVSNNHYDNANRGAGGAVGVAYKGTLQMNGFDVYSDVITKMVPAGLFVGSYEGGFNVRANNFYSTGRIVTGGTCLNFLWDLWNRNSWTCGTWDNGNFITYIGDDGKPVLSGTPWLHFYPCYPDVDTDHETESLANAEFYVNGIKATGTIENLGSRQIQITVTDLTCQKGEPIAVTVVFSNGQYMTFGCISSVDASNDANINTENDLTLARFDSIHTYEATAFSAGGSSCGFIDGNLTVDDNGHIWEYDLDWLSIGGNYNLNWRYIVTVNGQRALFNIGGHAGVLQGDTAYTGMFYGILGMTDMIKGDPIEVVIASYFDDHRIIGTADAPFTCYGYHDLSFENVNGHAVLKVAFNTVHDFAVGDVLTAREHDFHANTSTFTVTAVNGCTVTFESDANYFVRTLAEMYYEKGDAYFSFTTGDLHLGQSLTSEEEDVLDEKYAETVSKLTPEQFDLNSLDLVNIGGWGESNAANLFDGNNWGTKLGGAVSGDGSAAVVWRLNESAKVVYYKVYTGGDTSGNPNRNPKGWTLYGSVDGENYVALDTVDYSGMRAVDNTGYTYEVHSPMECMYYKLVFNARESIQLNEVELFAQAADEPITPPETTEPDVTGTETPVTSDETPATSDETPVTSDETPVTTVPSNPGNPGSPSTGDFTVLSVAIAVAALAGMVLILKKKSVK